MMNNAVIGIDLGGTNIRVGKVSEGKISRLESEGINREGDPGLLLEQIARLVKKVIGPEVNGVGMGVPSVVDLEAGIVYDVQNIPGWDEVPVKSILEKKLDLPVTVNNDANCFALGEKLFGKGEGYESVVGLILGTGFAAGLVLDGQLYNGKNCGAGEVGMLPYRDSILEHYCSAQFFEREYGVRGNKVYERARNGDSEALKMYKEYGRHLGIGLKAVLYTYDPEIIVFGGSVRHGYPFFRESMRDSLCDFGYPRILESIKIESSEREHIAVLGAAALALEKAD